MAAIYNDGTVRYGSRVIKIPVSTGDDFVADNIEVTRPTNIIERTNADGEPSGWVAVAGFVTGTATLQLPNAVDPPLLGETFSTDFGPGAETFVLVEVTQPEDKSGEKKVGITFRKKIN